VVWEVAWAVVWVEEWVEELVETSLVALAEPWQVASWYNPCPWCCSRSPAGLGTMLFPTSRIHCHSRKGVWRTLPTATNRAEEAATTSSSNSNL